MRDQTISILIIALVVSFGVGFMVGSTRVEMSSPYPSNYNPVAAVESEGIKAAQASTKQCFDLIARQLTREATVGASPTNLPTH